jgi:hydrogenase expression/formation protein HypE
MSKLTNRVRGVLFDFDGTLTAPGALNFPAIKQLLGCPQGQPILEYLETMHPDRRSELMNQLEKKEQEAAEASCPNLGAEKCVSTLKDNGILLGILTRNSLSSVRKAMEKFESVSIRDFAAVITREISLPKPNPDGVRLAAKNMSILLRELMVVGDFRFDVIAGEAAGAQTVLLTNGASSVMLPGDPEPDYTVSHLEELLILLGYDLP